MESSVSRWSLVAPVDYRYVQEALLSYLSEDAFTKYKLRVELALVKALHNRGMCGADIVTEVEEACSLVTTEGVYAEEKITKHDIRALVNCLQRWVSDGAKPFIHMMSTSYDIVEPANALRFRDALQRVILPALIELENVLIELTEREANTIQIGRTHGKHGVPITFGFAIAQYVERLGSCIVAIREATSELVGKFSGAVGAFNSSSLFFKDPERFEYEVLANLGLRPARISTQILAPERMLRLLDEVGNAAGVMANLARDMRNLQRTEIGEVGEEFKATQVGSSTMPQKRNPINFENVESLWKIIVGRLVTVRLDQISDHQRDLTNSASSRTYGEILCYFLEMVLRLTNTMRKLRVDKANLRRNLELTKDLIAAEPMYLILASFGHPNAHEAVTQLTLKAEAGGITLMEAAEADPSLKPYFDRMTLEQKDILGDPTLYVGIAPAKAVGIAQHWQTVLSIGRPAGNSH